MVLNVSASRLTRIAAGKFAETALEDRVALAVGSVGTRIDDVMDAVDDLLESVNAVIADVFPRMRRFAFRG